MKTLLGLIMLAVSVWAPLALAEHGGDSAQMETSAPAQARQFDFLIGQWAIELTPKASGLAAMIHGSPHLQGSWKAWRAFDGHGVEDELRVIDSSGNPRSLNYALRLYDSKGDQWLISGLDVYRALTSRATAQWKDGEMLVNGNGSDHDGKPFQTRTRFSEITGDGFRMQQDRSFDSGVSWDEDAIIIVATRAAAIAPR